MSRYSDDLILTLATYIKQTDKTVREVAMEYGLAKSTVYDMMTKSLKRLNPVLADEINTIFQQHKNSGRFGGKVTNNLVRIGELRNTLEIT